MCTNVMEACIIIQNTVFYARQSVYISKLYDEALKAVVRGCLLDEDQNIKQFKLLSRDEIGNERGQIINDFE